MSDHFTQASFVVTATLDDEIFLDEIVNLNLSAIAEDEFTTQYDQRSDRFKATFPPGETDPFENYRNMFSDPNFPYPSIDVARFGEAPDGRKKIVIYGDQIDVETVGNIIQAALPSALPTGFAYAFTCSKLRPDEFGGGYVIVKEDEVLFRSTSHMLDRELEHTVSEDERPLVLTTRDAEDGLLFWNNQTGFGRLADATVFTPREAENTPAVIAADEPEWITAPRWSL